jgi:hypothetical protein
MAKRLLEHNTKHKTQNTKHKTQNTKTQKHTTTNMIRHRHTTQQLCYLSPWQHSLWPQIKAHWLYVSLLKVPGGVFALVTTCSFVWGAHTYPIKI